MGDYYIFLFIIFVDYEDCILIVVLRIVYFVMKLLDKFFIDKYKIICKYIIFFLKIIFKIKCLSK